MHSCFTCTHIKTIGGNYGNYSFTPTLVCPIRTNQISLKLINSKITIRLVHREVDNATLTSIEEKIAKEKAKLAKMAASGSALAERQASTSTSTSVTMETSASGTATETQNKSQPEPMETDEPKVFSSASEPVAKREVSADKTESSMSEGARSKDQAPSKRDEAQSAGIHFSAPGSNEHLPPDIRAVSYTSERYYGSLLPTAYLVRDGR